MTLRIVPPQRHQTSFHFAIPDYRQCVTQGEFRRLLLTSHMSALLPSHLRWKLKYMDRPHQHLVRFFSLANDEDIQASSGRSLNGNNNIGSRALAAIKAELGRFGLTTDMSPDEIFAWEREGESANDARMQHSL